jgi:preprotein translocase subunit SecE
LSAQNAGREITTPQKTNGQRRTNWNSANTADSAADIPDTKKANNSAACIFQSKKKGTAKTPLPRKKKPRTVHPRCLYVSFPLSAAAIISSGHCLQQNDTAGIITGHARKKTALSAKLWAIRILGRKMGRLLRKKLVKKNRTAKSPSSRGQGGDEKKTAMSAPVSGEEQKKPSPRKKSAPLWANSAYPGKIMQFLREVRAEFRKVTWPSRKQTLGSTFVVIIVVVIISAFLGLMDTGLSGLIRVILQ